MKESAARDKQTTRTFCYLLFVVFPINPWLLNDLFDIHGGYISTTTDNNNNNDSTVAMVFEANTQTYNDLRLIQDGNIHRLNSQSMKDILFNGNYCRYWLC